jgi:hypothetical protein
LGPEDPARSAMSIVALSIDPFAATRKFPALMAKELGLILFDLAPFERHIAERISITTRNALIDFCPAIADRRWHMTITDLAARLQELALETAQHGDVLIHGWTAVSMLGCLSHVATVRLHASAHHRTLEMQKCKKYPLLDCAALDLASEDDLRARLMSNVLGKPLTTLTPADLDIDMERVSERRCLALVAALAADPLYTHSARTEAEIAERLFELR